MSRRCCCCEPVLTDDFNRADSTSIGSNWSEDAGDWEISGNTLTCNDAGARVISTASSALPYMHIDVKLKVTAAGTHAFRIIANYVDSDNYHYCRISVDDDGAGKSLMQLCVRSGGTETVLSTQPIRFLTNNEWFRVRFCVVSGGFLQAYVRTDSSTCPAAEVGATVFAAGKKMGFAVEDATDWYIDDLVWSPHKNGDSCPDCNTDCLTCLDAQVASQVKVVLSGIVRNGLSDVCHDCPGRDGTYILDYDSCDVGDESNTWSLDIDASACPAAIGTPTIALRVDKGGANGAFRVQVTLNYYDASFGGPAFIRWSSDVDDSPDCDGWVNQSIAFETNGSWSYCDGSAATCLITSL